ncbi:3'(2'),5'-bisphosphate nucleotidase CysQ [Mesorhizobium sp. Z1-4]|uniref:3'(2'),5'-bisphosphate nucleotidase CysQ n=1 Tax=Mesorhizobium sp. Z1-4 TaxID=2448478 RepID=UPI000FD947E8|nr:3'(2'),5'-bisphosphate nucleotidase CysQ [Mesorhizobium sp. Z1-4]
MPPASDEEISSAFERIAIDAGRAAYALFKNGCKVEHKPDKSPVTEADRAAEEIIQRGLAAALPGIAVVAEEAVAEGRMPAALGDEFILVDPLDGTREFVGGRGDFTVNIALVRKSVPEIGVVYAPARGWLFVGRPGLAEKVVLDETFQVASRHRVHVRQSGDALDILASHSHKDAATEHLIASMKVGKVHTVGSSLKFCLLAAGEADIYPRCGPTMQWDTAAGDAVLRAAGGTTSTLDGAPLIYGYREGSGSSRLANPAFIARGGKAKAG